MGQIALERRLADSPEPKLELIDGCLIAGNNPAGSRYLLWDILKGWGAAAALPMAPSEEWLRALSFAFQSLQCPDPRKPLSTWKAWAAQVSYQPAVAAAGPHGSWPHYGAANRLRMGLYEVSHDAHLGISLGPDFVMRLGDNAFTPDVLLARPNRLDALHSYFLDGPADLVIEVLLPGHEAQDREVKRRHHAASGVPEYWVVDPQTKSVEFLRLSRDGYRQEGADPDGFYRPQSAPGLALRLELLWNKAEEVFHYGHVFVAEGSGPALHLADSEDEVGWGYLSFQPRPRAEPWPLSFEEYISWCPRAKFERVRGRPLIGGTPGTRNVLGMLLRTFGLADAVTLLHPTRWIAALEEANAARPTDAARKATWWGLARQAASLLREKYRMNRLAVIGDLARSEPLNLWSDITIVAWDLPEAIPYEAHRDLFELNREPGIDLIQAEHASPAQRREMEQAVEL
jgi:hypothetical protein